MITILSYSNVDTEEIIIQHCDGYSSPDAGHVVRISALSLTLGLLCSRRCGGSCLNLLAGILLLLLIARVLRGVEWIELRLRMEIYEYHDGAHK